jgi:L-amino acid N-acyltransferase YncA
MKQFSIRKATLNDANQISVIWSVICAERIYTAVNIPFSPEQERQYISSLTHREAIFIAEKSDQIIGFQSLDLWAKYTDSFDHVGVVGTFILPEWRQKSIGTELTKKMFNFARMNSYEKLIIYVRSKNSGAITFYKNMGFIEKGILTRQVKIDNQYDDEIFLELFL